MNASDQLYYCKTCGLVTMEVILQTCSPKGHILRLEPWNLSDLYFFEEEQPEN